MKFKHNVFNPEAKYISKSVDMYANYFGNSWIVLEIDIVMEIDTLFSKSGYESNFVNVGSITFDWKKVKSNIRRKGLSNEI